MYGFCWKGGKVRCVLMEVVGYKVLKIKGDWGLSSMEFIFILLILGMFYFVEFCKLCFCLFIYLVDFLKVKLKNKFCEVYFYRYS